VVLGKVLKFLLEGFEFSLSEVDKILPYGVQDFLFEVADVDGRLLCGCVIGRYFSGLALGVSVFAFVVCFGGYCFRLVFGDCFCGHCFIGDCDQFRCAYQGRSSKFVGGILHSVLVSWD